MIKRPDEMNASNK